MAKTVNARYKAPDELNCSEPFENAQIIAKQEAKWMLINIQQGDDFSSHTLNHTFNDEMMQEIIAGSFIFWQRKNTSGEGERFANYYKIYDFPVICAIDPRTGRLMTKWAGKKFQDVHMAAESLFFCDARIFHNSVYVAAIL